MHFYNLINGMAKKSNIKLFIDMDGVIAAYNFGKPLEFKNKRPLTTNIETIKKVKTIDNVELHILSICRQNFQRDDKNNWLDKNAPFFKKENRHILSKEEIRDKSSAEIKLEFLKNYETNDLIVLVDDDNKVLSTIDKGIKNVILLQDSELID